MIAYVISREVSSNVLVSISDSGFMLSVPIDGKVNIRKVLASIDEESCREVLEKAVENTHLLKSLFRVNACRSFMILRNYMGKKKSARRQQVSADMLIYYARKLDDFAVLKESYREIIEDKFEVENILEVLSGIRSGEIEVTEKISESPSPMAFGIASIGASDVVYAQDKLSLLKEFHRRVMDKIHGDRLGDKLQEDDLASDNLSGDKLAGEDAT
jgi:ATP-dependent Lhr-like helicase